MVKFITRTICMALVAVLCVGANAQNSMSPLKKVTLVEKDVATVTSEDVVLTDAKIPFEQFQNSTEDQSVTNPFDNPALKPLFSKGNTAYAHNNYGSPAGYVSFDVEAPGSQTLLVGTIDLYGGDCVDGVLYTYSEYGNFLKINSTTGAIIETINGANSEFMSDMAYDYYGETMWGTKSGKLYTINLETGAATLAATLSGYTGSFLLTIAVDLEGNMYGIEAGTSGAGFYSVNKTTGVCTLIGPTGKAANYAQSMGFDHNTGILYWPQCAAIGDMAFTSVNTSTGAATTIASTGCEQMCFHVPYEGNSDPCPTVTNLKAEVQGTDVVLTWDAAEGTPTGYKIYDGNTALGTTATELTYIALDLSGGEHTLAVEALYEDDCSPKKVTVDVLIGNCNGVSNTAVTFDADCGSAVITWDGVPSKEITEPIEVLSESFASGTLPSDWTNLDADGDGRTWRFTLVLNDGVTLQDTEGRTDAHSINSGSYYNDIGALTPDNWLITPKIELGGNTVLTYWVKVIDASYPSDTYGVFVSTTGTNPSDFTEVFKETLTAAAANWVERTVNISQRGDCHIAFRHFNSNDQYIFCIDDILVETEDSGEPEPPKYNVYRDGVKIAGPIEETTFTDNSITADVEYTWAVAVVCGNGADSKWDRVTDMCGDTEPCNPPTNAKAAINTETCEVAFTWEWDGEGEGIFKVTRNGVVVKENAVSPYTETLPQDDVEYEFCVIRVCPDGDLAPVCADTKVNCPVGINDLKESVKIYPNPATSVVTIEGKDMVKVEVYNVVGQMIEMKTGEIRTIDVSTYNNGIYLFRVYDSNNNVITKRIMVTK